MTTRTTCSLALGLMLVLQTAVAWGQGDDRSANGWFRVKWEPRPASVVPRIGGRVHNESQYRVTNVRLQIEGLDADSAPVGRSFTWAFGDIAPGGETSFVAEPMPSAVAYRIDVVSFDVVSGPQAP